MLIPNPEAFNHKTLKAKTLMLIPNPEAFNHKTIKP